MTITNNHKAALAKELRAGMDTAKDPKVRETLKRALAELTGVSERLTAEQIRVRIAADLQASGINDEPEFLNITDNALTVLKARYFLRDTEGKIIEDAAGMFHRVANAVAEGDRVFDEKADVAKSAAQFYDMMARLWFVPNSPTMMNAGTGAGTLSACFVLPLNDSMQDIMKTATDIAMVQKFGGGTGIALSNLRHKGAPISTTHGRACGPIAVLKHLSSVSTMITQGGKRDGANMAVMSIHHPDILEFIDCKKVEGQIHNYNISVGVDEEFMRAVENGGKLALRDPRTKALVKEMDAREVFTKIVEGAWRNGEPGMIFLDEVNRTNPVHDNVGPIEATNPCGEQPLLPYESCNLGSINLSKMVDYTNTGAVINWDRLRDVTHTAVHFLDNVIDVNKYSVPEIEHMTKHTRKIGLGVMGFADMLFRMGVAYDSEEGVRIGRAVMKFIMEESDNKSEALAKVRGVFPAWKGSKFDVKGGRKFRNACRMTVAPTGTISMIAGCSSGVEPIFALAFRKQNILGGQTLYYAEKAFEAVAHSEGFYSEDLMSYLSEGNSLTKRDDVPGWVRTIFTTAPDISPEYHVRMQAAFQESTDAAISKTINFPNEATLDDVREAYMKAWKLKCKGITVYRAGSRDLEVLTVGQTDKAKAPALQGTLVAAEEQGDFLTPRERPNAVSGVTERIRTGHGNMYITINFDEENKPFEIFSALGKAGGCDAAQHEAVSRLASLALRAGVDPANIVEQLRGITCCPAWDQGQLVRSGPDAVAIVLSHHLAKGPSLDHADTATVTLFDQGAQAKPVEQPTKSTQSIKFTVAPAKPTGNQNVMDISNKPIEGSRLRCPDCSSTLIYQEGCVKCSSCAWNKCG